MNKKTILILAPLLAAALTAGCATKEPVKPPPEPEPAPIVAAPPPRPEPQRVVEKVGFALEVPFDSDRVLITPQAQASLDTLADKIRGVDVESVVAVGHADSTGGDAYNQRLSERRADMVKAYLVHKGLDARRIRTAGKGRKEPLAKGDTEQARAKNRRVRIEISGTQVVLR